MKYRIYQLFITICLLGTGCSDDLVKITPHDPDEDPYDFDFDCDFDIGEYMMLQSSIDYIPYAGKSSVTFTDSLGDSLQLIIEAGSLLTHDGALFKYNVFADGDTVRYCYNSQFITYFLTNDSLELHFRLRVAARPYYNDPLEEFIADEFSITHLVDNSLSIKTLFHKTLAQRTFPFIFDDITFFPSLTFFGKEFIDVEKDQIEDPYIEVFYNATQGIVSFRDLSGTAWRFESMN